MSLVLTDQQTIALRRAALNGDYHLLLGAGASRDSISAGGKHLPLSAELIRSIAKEFDVETEEGDLLWRVYDRAVNIVGSTPIYDWLRSLFWGVTAPDWMDIYARTPWSAAWTLNVDDTFEAAYARVKTEASRPIVTLNWDDDFRIGRELPVIHLHGCLDRETPRNLVFSLSEYASSAVSRAAWPLNFRDIYGVSPFVVIGARLRDEPDIEAIVSKRRPTHEAPSFYVSPDISSATEADLRNWNLIPVRMTASEFALEWAITSGLNLDVEPTQLQETAYRVGRQFAELRTNETSPAPAQHDFLGGDEPLWSDIQRDLAAELDWIRQARLDCRQLGTTLPASSALIYVGARLTGRSAGLLALAKTLRSQSWRTFLYSTEMRPDVDALLRFAADDKSIALLFDGISDVAEDISALLIRARGSGLKVACIGVDHSDNAANILGRIDDSLLTHRRIGSINRRLTRTDATQLVDKLAEKGRLGVLEQEQDLRRISHFRNHELFDAMAQLESAPGFGRRVGDLVEKVVPIPHLELVFLSAFAARVGRTLLVVDAARMVGIESDVLVRLVADDPALSSVLSTNGEWLKARHRWMSLEHVVARLGQESAMRLLSEALSRVAMRMNRKSQWERNATAMLVGALMAHRNLRVVFADADLDGWYESLSGSFGSWSARYWEQRAITARHAGAVDPGLLSKAESYALRAAGIVRDAYSLTTLGTVLLAKAAFSPQIDVPAYYDRALRAYEDASNDRAANLVSWLAYLRHALDVLSRARNESYDEPDFYQRLTDDWSRVYSLVSTVASSSDETKDALAGLHRKFGQLERG